MKKFLFLISILSIVSLRAQDKTPYKIYDRVGQEMSYQKMLSVANKSDLVLFGELHDNSLIHWLQIEFIKDLKAKKEVAIGVEMFERDNQDEIDAYFSNKITEKEFDSVARFWANYKTDYKPILEYAKSMKIPFYATNVPRKYARLVYSKGFESLDTLSVAEKKHIAPLPIQYDAELPGYKSMINSDENHSNANLPKAQALKDATMAFSINGKIKEKQTYIHLNGTYHSENFEGINWYLKKLNSDLKILTIATVEQDDIIRFEKENQNKADIIIVIDKDITKTQ